MEQYKHLPSGVIDVFEALTICETIGEIARIAEKPLEIVMKRWLRAGLLCAALGAKSVIISEVTGATLTVTSSNDSGPGSLREAVAVAETGDEIRFSAALGGAAIQLTSGQIVIGKGLTLRGEGPNQTIIRGPERFSLTDIVPNRIFEVGPAALVQITGVTLSGGIVHADKDDLGGGAILNRGTLILTNSLITENTAISRRGGGIYNSGGTLKLRDVHFVNNYIDSGTVIGGGGIYNDAAGTVDLVRCVFADQNTIKSIGGGIANEGVMTIESSRFEHNYGWGGGGAVDNRGVLHIRDSLVIRNLTHSEGGAISNSGELSLERTAIIQNWAEGDGGGLTNRGEGNATILNTTFFGNGTHRFGGAIRTSGGIVSLDHVTLAGNTVDNDEYYLSGGIQNGTGPYVGTGSGVVRLRNSLIIGNYSNDCEVTAERNTCIADCFGSFESEGHNIIGSLYASDIYNPGEFLVCDGFSMGQGDLVSTNVHDVMEFTIIGANYATPRPIEVPILGENGGPTPTVALIPKSFAIDSVPLSDCTDFEPNLVTSDQRGISRPQGPACDIGAFEFSQPRDTLFWMQQCRQASSAEYNSDQLSQFFAAITEKSGAFPECAPASCAALEPDSPRSSWKGKAARELLAVWLNLASGRLTNGRPINLAGLSSATTVGGAVAEVEATICNTSATRQDLAKAKDISESLNERSN